jgi:ketosteroid isomerase-like protein
MQTRMIDKITRLAFLLLFASIQFFCNSQNLKSQVMNTVKENPSVKNTASDDIAAIRELEDRFVEAVSSGDVDGIMKCYIPDRTLHVFDVVPRKEYYGADNYRRSWEDFFTHYKGIPKMTLSDLEIIAEGNLAFGHSLTNVKGADSKGNPLDRFVRVSVGYRKINGNWLKVHEHISVPVDFMSGKLVPVPKP